jgi:hypothetical protein
MNQPYIVLEEFTYETLCFCPGGDHRLLYLFSKGDIVELECQITDDHDLFYIVIINNTYTIQLSKEGIHENLLAKRFVSFSDLSYMINQTKLFIDYALDCRDQDSFMHYSHQLKEYDHLMGNFTADLQQI